MLRRHLAAFAGLPLLARQAKPPQAAKPRPMTPEQALDQARLDIQTRIDALRQDLVDRMRTELRQQLRIDLKQELRAELRTELKQEIKQELRYELKSEIKQELRMEMRQD